MQFFLLKKDQVLMILVVLFLAHNTSSLAQTAQWNGSVDTNWDNASNWTFAGGGALTNASTVYTIPASATGPTTAMNAAITMRQLTMNNNATATIPSGFTLNISGAGGVGFYNKGGFTNNGTLNISSSSNNALRNEGTFNNTLGTIVIEDCGRDGISNANGGTFNNTSTIHIGQNSTVGDEGIWNGAIFNNNSGGVIHVYNASEVGIYNESGTFNNSGTINIGQGGGLGVITFEGIWTKQSFYNLSSGIIKIDNCGHEGVRVDGGTGFSNSGQLLIGTTGGANNVQVGLNISSGSFGNPFGSTLKIDNTSSNGINIANGNTLLNGGDIIVGTLGIISGDGIHVASGGTLRNEWTDIVVTGTSGKSYNIFGALDNLTGTIKGTGVFDFSTPTSFSGSLSPGMSPGIITFNHAQTFSSASNTVIEVDGPTAGTQHDQIIVNGNATIGGWLNVSINYTPVANDRIIILDASTVTGTYAVSPALPDNWIIDYSVPGEVALEFVGILPVELIDFSISRNAQNALLQWQTASELNNKGFEVQHSSDGRNWNYLDFVDGNGNSSQHNHYSFIHRTPIQGVNYYRLRQLDFDGMFEYSAIASIDFEYKEVNIKTYPNPTTSSFNVHLPQGFIQTEASIHDSNGQLIFRQRHQEGQGLLSIDVNNWSPGLYFIYLLIDDHQYTQKLIISD